MSAQQFNLPPFAKACCTRTPTTLMNPSCGTGVGKKWQHKLEINPATATHEAARAAGLRQASPTINTTESCIRYAQQQTHSPLWCAFTRQRRYKAVLLTFFVSLSSGVPEGTINESTVTRLPALHTHSHTNMLQDAIRCMLRETGAPNIISESLSLKEVYVIPHPKSTHEKMGKCTRRTIPWPRYRKNIFWGSSDIGYFLN